MYLLKKVFELRDKSHPEAEKPFLEHMEDLRIMVTRVVITLLISMIICFSFQKQLMNILRAPAESVLLAQQKETMPNATKHEGIKVPTVEIWEEAKKIEAIASSLNETERVAFYEALAQVDMPFHARSVTLLRAAKALPQDKRSSFIDQLDESKLMKKQLHALLESDPSIDPSAGSNIRMMSALKPTETFMLSMKLSFFAGIVLAFPLLLWFILLFILPGLHDKEKKVLWPAMLIGFGLFLSGIFFAYYFVLPRALLFFYIWSGELGVSNDWRIGEYITFATQFTLLFGLAFELPVVVMVLVKLGLLSYEIMSSTRTYSTVAIFIAAAVITPTPDIMTLLLMALPMLVLYEICIWLAWFQRRKEKREELAEEEEMRIRRQQWLIAHQNDEERDHHDCPQTEEEEYPPYVPEPFEPWHDSDTHHTPYPTLPEDEGIASEDHSDESNTSECSIEESSSENDPEKPKHD